MNNHHVSYSTGRNELPEVDPLAGGFFCLHSGLAYLGFCTQESALANQPDSLSSGITTFSASTSDSLYQIVVFSVGLYGAMWLKPVFDKSDKHTPLVIFSGISHINTRRLDSLLKPLEYKDNISLQKWVVFIDKELKVDCPTDKSIDDFCVETSKKTEIDSDTLKTLDVHCKKAPKIH